MATDEHGSAVSDTGTASLAHRQVSIGWWALLVFVAGGLILEALHGLKVDWYLNAGNETRRLLLRLAHAHGALVAVLTIIYGLTLRCYPLSRARFIARVLLAALVLLPGGFMLGGLWLYDGDPGLGIVLSPVGALALCLAVGLIALDLTRRGP